MKLDTRTLRRLGTLLGALLIAAMLSACSDSRETVPGDEDGSWEEYVAWCSQALLRTSRRRRSNLRGSLDILRWSDREYEIGIPAG